MTRQSLKKRSVLLSYIPRGYEPHESTLYNILTLVLGEFEDFVSFTSNKGHTRIYVVFRTSALAQSAISLKKIGIAGLEQHIEITELQNGDLDRLKTLRETRISHTGAASQSKPTEPVLPVNTITTESASQSVDHNITMTRDQHDILFRLLQEAQTQRDAALAALAVSQQEPNQQLTEAQSIIVALEERLQNAAREREERDKQWHRRCEMIKSESEERLKNAIDAKNEDRSLMCTGIREEWSNKLTRELKLANTEWRTRLEMREVELKSQYQKELGHIEAEAQWRARIDEERKQLVQELIAARETIRLSNDAKEVEITMRMALEHQLEDVRARERIQPKLMKAFLLVDAIERQTSQETSLQHSSGSLTPPSLRDLAKKLLITEEPPDSAFACDSKRRRLS